MTVRYQQFLAAFCRTRDVQWLAIFGSALRADFGPDSDMVVSNTTSGPEPVCLQRFKKPVHRPYVNTIFSPEGTIAVIDKHTATQARQV